jgi:hypothetical protein
MPDDTIHVDRFILTEPIEVPGLGWRYRARTPDDEHAYIGWLYRNPFLASELPEVVTLGRQAPGLVHPNIVQLLAAGHKRLAIGPPEGFLYAVTEVVDADAHLATRVPGAPAPPAHALRMMGQVAAAVQAAAGGAHSHGWLAPECIYLRAAGAVAMVNPWQGWVEGRLRQHRTTGTSNWQYTWVAPETVFNPDKVTIGSDLFTVCALGYAMCTGQPPFDSASALTLDPALFQLEVTDPRRLRPDMPEGLAQILERGLAPRWEDRYHDPMALLRDLELVAGGALPDAKAVSASSAGVASVPIDPLIASLGAAPPAARPAPAARPGSDRVESQRRGSQQSSRTRASGRHERPARAQSGGQAVQRPKRVRAASESSRGPMVVVIAVAAVVLLLGGVMAVVLSAGSQPVRIAAALAPPSAAVGAAEPSAPAPPTREHRGGLAALDDLERAPDAGSWSPAPALTPAVVPGEASPVVAEPRVEPAAAEPVPEPEPEEPRVAHEPVLPLDSEVVPGVRQQSYLGTFEFLPDFSTLTPSATQLIPAINLAAAPRSNDYALLIEGLLKVSDDGLYRFRLDSDDGAQLFIAGERVVDLNRGYQVNSGGGVIRLQAGFHPLRIAFHQGPGNQNLRLRWSSDSVETMTELTEALFHRVDASPEDVVSSPSVAAVASSVEPEPAAAVEPVGSDGLAQDAVSLATIRKGVAAICAGRSAPHRVPKGWEPLLSDLVTARDALPTSIRAHGKALVRSRAGIDFHGAKFELSVVDDAGLELRSSDGRSSMRLSWAQVKPEQMYALLNPIAASLSPDHREKLWQVGAAFGVLDRRLEHHRAAWEIINGQAEVVAEVGTEAAAQSVPRTIPHIVLTTNDAWFAPAQADWEVVADSDAIEGLALKTRHRLDTSGHQIEVSKPYLLFIFDAEAGRDYHVWMRGICRPDEAGEDRRVRCDAVDLVFETPVSFAGDPYRQGLSAEAYPNMATVAGWGKRDGWHWRGGNGDRPTPEQDDQAIVVRFAESGLQRMRVHLFEGSSRFDAIWLSSEQKTRPGDGVQPPSTQRKSSDTPRVDGFVVVDAKTGRPVGAPTPVAKEATLLMSDREVGIVARVSGPIMGVDIDGATKRREGHRPFALYGDPSADESSGVEVYPLSLQAGVYQYVVRPVAESGLTHHFELTVRK